MMEVDITEFRVYEVNHSLFVTQGALFLRMVVNMLSKP